MRTWCWLHALLCLILWHYVLTNNTPCSDVHISFGLWISVFYKHSWETKSLKKTNILRSLCLVPCHCYLELQSGFVQGHVWQYTQVLWWFFFTLKIVLPLWLLFLLMLKMHLHLGIFISLLIKISPTRYLLCRKMKSLLQWPRFESRLWS